VLILESCGALIEIQKEVAHMLWPSVCILCRSRIIRGSALPHKKKFA
jgi:hypothetical protein